MYKPNFKIVHQDTINIRGIVYNACGDPVNSVQIYSQNKELLYEGYPIYVYTDREGKFELKGALVKDSLTIYLDKKISIVNNGSRYLEIHLPPAKTDIKTSATLSAPRKFKKKSPPKFKVVTNAQIMDWGGLGFTQIAEFPSSFKKFPDYIRNHITYPEKAIKNNIEGDVEIGFTIERDGSLTNFKPIRGIGYDCETAVIDGIKKSPNWKPAVFNGRPIKSESSVTINFSLTDN
jgi:hypothetical protein